MNPGLSLELSGPTSQWTPRSFPSPVLISCISALKGVLSAYWLLCQFLGCTLQACKTCTYPASRLKGSESATDTTVAYWMGEAYMSKARSWSNTQLSGASGRQAEYGGRLTSYRGNWCKAGSSVTRETIRGACPSQSILQANRWRCSDLKLQQLLAVLGQVCRKVSQVSEVYVKQVLVQ